MGRTSLSLPPYVPGPAATSLKGAQQQDLLRAVRAVAQGQAVFRTGVADRLLATFSSARAPRPFPELTDRQREILSLITGGEGNVQIARRLGLSAKTVANHVSNILTKLQAQNRAETIAVARKAGLDNHEAR
jgi:DNA-binding NarL/FixJ family response regulator